MDNKLEHIKNTNSDLSASVNERNIVGEHKFREIFENAPDGILHLDKKGYILDCNPAYCKMLDFSKEELIGSHVTESLVKEQRPLFKENHPTLIKKGKLLLEEINLTKKNGEIIKVRRHANAIYDSNGEYSGIIVHSHDITKQKELEEQLFNIKKLEAVGLMASSLAHEFKNILQSIMGYSHFAIKGLDINEQRYKDIEQIQKAADRADILVRNLLKTGKRFDLNLMRININSIVNKFIDSNKNYFGENISLNYTHGNDVDSMIVNGDPIHIELVLLNIFMNAADAIENKGSIKVKTKIERNKIIQKDIYNWLKNKDFVKISISDNGNGIDKNNLEHIFEPFFTTKAVDKGIGLGLSSVFEIIKSHKGFIEVKSTVDIGTTFYIYIPLSA